jgi:hypothetical protein
MINFIDDSLCGRHNFNLQDAAERLIKSNTYRDLSTVWVTPSPKGQLDTQVVFSSWLTLQKPMNQKILPVGITNAEVGQAYEAAVEMILRDSVKWKYMLTLEHDNLPPRDGLLKLYESIDQFDAVGGLYWMKGENGNAMIYGDPAEPGSFIPQVPQIDTVQPCNGLGTGFVLFNVDMFRKIPQPWFRTSGASDSGAFTQDLFFFEKAAKYGFKFACDTRVKVGHLDLETRKIW